VHREYPHLPLAVHTTVLRSSVPMTSPAVLSESSSGPVPSKTAWPTGSCVAGL